MKRNIKRKQAANDWRRLEDYLNSNFQNDTRPRSVEVDVPLALAVQRQLRIYAQTWIEANYRIEEWSLREQIETDINNQTICLSQALPLVTQDRARNDTAEPFDQKPLAIRVSDFSSVDTEDLAGNLELEGQMRASSLFFEFITSEFWNRLRICTYCSNFFVNTRGHENKVFCSPECAKTGTALTSTRVRREREYNERLEKIERAIEALGRLPPAERRRISWKRWLADITSIDQRFITRAVKQGKVQVPTGLKQ